MAYSNSLILDVPQTSKIEVKKDLIELIDRIQFTGNLKILKYFPNSNLQLAWEESVGCAFGIDSDFSLARFTTYIVKSTDDSKHNYYSQHNFLLSKCKGTIMQLWGNIRDTKVKIMYNASHCVCN